MFSKNKSNYKKFDIFNDINLKNKIKQVSIPKKNAAGDADPNLDIRKMPYVGYLIWSRKSCGGDFLARIADGRIKLEFFDYGQYN